MAKTATKKPKDITKIVIDYKSACKHLKRKTTLPDFSNAPPKHKKALIAHYKLITITEALNDGWEPNWNDRSEYKYQPWFGIKADEKHPSGSGFTDSDYVTWRTSTISGSRLCFKSRELCLYAVKQFEELFIDYYLM